MSTLSEKFKRRKKKFIEKKFMLKVKTNFPLKEFLNKFPVTKHRLVAHKVSLDLNFQSSIDWREDLTVFLCCFLVR